MARCVKSTPRKGAVTTSDAGDIRPNDWVERFLPAPLRGYARLMRLDRPIGAWLLLFPCWWGVAFGALAPDRVLLWYMALFAIGALVMRGAGCTWNDITDRKYDAAVARTRTRPIPSGQVTVVRAFIFMGALMLIGFAVLVQFNRFTVWLGIASLALAAIYPLMKRFTYWPQFFLGLAFNYGALLGWAAMNASLDVTVWPGGWPAIFLYLGGIAWTLGYDTIYAHQDKEDDVLIGVKSTALKLGARTRLFLFGFYAAAVSLIFYAGWLMGLGKVFWGFLALASIQLAWQAARVSLDEPADCLRKFKSNRLFGWLVLAGLIGDPMLQGLI